MRRRRRIPTMVDELEDFDELVERRPDDGFVEAVAMPRESETMGRALAARMRRRTTRTDDAARELPEEPPPGWAEP